MPAKTAVKRVKLGMNQCQIDGAVFIYRSKCYRICHIWRYQTVSNLSHHFNATVNSIVLMSRPRWYECFVYFSILKQLSHIRTHIHQRAVIYQTMNHRAVRGPQTECWWTNIYFIVYRPLETWQETTESQVLLQFDATNLQRIFSLLFLNSQGTNLLICLNWNKFRSSGWQPWLCNLISSEV